MAGMQGLGRVFDVVPIASGAGLSLKNASAVTFVLTGATGVATLSIATSFAGTYRAANFFTPAWAPISTVYWNTATDGSAAWAKATITAAATFTNGTTTGLTTSINSVFTVFGSQLPDLYDYIKCTATGSGLCTAILHDLTVQRTPANLVKLGA